MCLAVPGRVLDINDRDGTRMARMDFGGVVKDVCLEYLPELECGDYAVVHVGFALQRLDEESARQTLELFENLGVLDEEFGDAWERAAEETGQPRPADTTETAPGFPAAGERTSTPLDAAPAGAGGETTRP